MAICVGLIGYGLAGRYLHAPFFAPAGLVLRAVATSRRQEVAQDHPAAAVCVEPGGLIARDDVDLVVIATPNDSHALLARKALEAGKHVVIDKPMTVRVEEADELIDTAARAGRVLTVYQNRRWDADFMTVQSIIAGGDLGRLALFESRWDRFRPQIQPRWREEERHGGGMLNDLGPHLADQALQLLGWPDWVQGDELVQRQGSTLDDGFSMRLGYGPMRAILEVSSLSAQPRARFHLHGEAAAYVKHGLDPQENQLRGGLGPLSTGFGHEEFSQQGIMVDGSGRQTLWPSLDGRWLSFWEGVRASIADGVPPPVDPAEARDALSILATARESARAGKRLLPSRPRSDRYLAGASQV